MRTLTLFILSFALPCLCGAAVIDPVGDTYGTGLPFDITSISGITDGSSTTFEIRFVSPVPAGLDANLWGAIEINVDRDFTTGKTSELDFPTMNFPDGVDYVIGFYYDDDPGTAAILDVTNNNFFSLPAIYGPDFVRITVPIAGTNGDARMYYAAGVGDGQDIMSAYSDIVGNNYQLLTTETPEPGSLALCLAGIALTALARRRREGDRLA